MEVSFFARTCRFSTWSAYFLTRCTHSDAVRSRAATSAFIPSILFRSSPASSSRACRSLFRPDSSFWSAERASSCSRLRFLRNNKSPTSPRKFCTILSAGSAGTLTVFEDFTGRSIPARRLRKRICPAGLSERRRVRRNQTTVAGGILSIGIGNLPKGVGSTPETDVSLPERFLESPGSATGSAGGREETALKVLVLNSGSSSIKYRLFRMESMAVLRAGVVDRIGEPGPSAVRDHGEGFGRVMADLSDSGAIGEPASLFGIGHRVVHGGERFREPVRVDHRNPRCDPGDDPLRPAA